MRANLEHLNEMAPADLNKRVNNSRFVRGLWEFYKKHDECDVRSEFITLDDEEQLTFTCDSCKRGIILG